MDVVNPLKFNNLEDYTEYITWQKTKGKEVGFAVGSRSVVPKSFSMPFILFSHHNKNPKKLKHYFKVWLIFSTIFAAFLSSILLSISKIASLVKA